MKKNYDVPDVNSRKLNRTNKRTDCTVMNDFERDLVRLFNTKNRHGAFGYFFLSLSDGEKPRNILKLVRSVEIELAASAAPMVHMDRRLSPN